MNQNIHAELERSKNDTIRVHNPTMEEFILEYDRVRTNTSWVFPPANKDQFGVGRGNRDVPKYIAIMFMEKMTDVLVDREAKKEWEKKKKNYGTRDNIAKEEERHLMGFRRNEEKKDIYRKQIWIGLVARQGDMISTKEDSYTDPGKTPLESAMERLGLDEMVVSQNLDDLIQEVSNDQE